MPLSDRRKLTYAGPRHLMEITINRFFHSLQTVRTALSKIAQVTVATNGITTDAGPDDLRHRHETFAETFQEMFEQTVFRSVEFPAYLPANVTARSVVLAIMCFQSRGPNYATAHSSLVSYRGPSGVAI